MAAKGNVKVFYREVVISCHEDDVEILEDTPEGIRIRHTYRKTGKREEFIPREKIDSIIYSDEKAPSTRKPKQAKVAKPAVEPDPEPVVEPDPEPVVDPDPVPETPVASEEGTDDTLSESESFDDDDEDDFFNDDFED